MSKELTFVIPTRSCPYFLRRMLVYHATMRSPHLIFIGDSSDAENHQKIQDMVKDYPWLNIDLIYSPPHLIMMD